jgi:DNA invertase Pin-like site-specific DNA recombinase
MTALVPVPQRRPRAFVYGRQSSYRDSSEYQHDDVDTSVGRQFQRVLEWCARENVEPFKTYPDDGYGAWTGKRRPSFEDLLGDLETLAAPGDVVPVWRFNRLTRNRRDLHRLLDTCRKRGVRLVSVTESFDSSVPMAGDMMAYVLGLMAEWDSDGKSEDLKSFIQRAKQAAERDGRPWVWGKRAFGWTPDGFPLTQEVVDALADGGQVVWTVKHKRRGAAPVEIEVPIIAEFEHLAEAGDRILDGEPLSPRERAEKGLTLAGVERDWAAAGIRSTMGKPISRAGLVFMLRNPRNAPAFGGPERHADMLRLLNDPARRSQRGNGRVHELTGRLQHDDPSNAHLCGRCLGRGTIATMRAIKGKRRNNPSYICAECGVSRQMTVVDTLTRDDLFYRLESWEIQEALANATATAQGKRQELFAEREPLQAHLGKLQESLNERRADPGTDWDDPEVKADLAAARNLKARVDKIDLDLARHGELVRRSRNPLLSEARRLAKHCERLERFWDGLDGGQRHELYVAAGLVRVVTHPVGKVGPCWSADPRAIERYWRLPDGELERIVGPSPGSREEPRLGKPPTSPQACACGCGELAAPGKRYRQGHNPKLGVRAAWLAAQPEHVGCHCGCGQLIPVRPWHSYRGLPRFKLGHHMRQADFKLGYRG